MGHLRKDVAITGQKTATIRMLVDTGATYSVLPTAVARAVGVTASHAMMMTVADGRRRKFKAGTAIVRIGNREAPTTVLVGDVVEPILGVETLEVLGLAVDPGRGRLAPTRPYTYRITGVR